MALARLKEGLIRLGDISLVAMAVGCGYVGYQWNASEDAAAKLKRIRDNQSLAQRRLVEERFMKIAKQYDLKVDELMERRNQAYKLTQEARTLSDEVSQHVKDVYVELEKLQKLIKAKAELEQLASSLSQRKRTLAAEVKELSKLVKIKEDLQARSTLICSAPTTVEVDELEILTSKVQERNRVLESEIKELMRLVKVKEELVAKSETLDEHGSSHLGDPMLKKDDPVRS